VKGLEVTIYDPERDPDGRAAGVLVNVLVDGFQFRRSGTTLR
jgi:hypothetical protein